MVEENTITIEQVVQKCEASGVDFMEAYVK